MERYTTPELDMYETRSTRSTEDENEPTEEERKLQTLQAEYERFKASVDANIEDQSKIIREGKTLAIDLALACHSSIYFYCTHHKAIKYPSTEERYYGYAYEWASYQTLRDYTHWLNTSYRERLQMRAIEVEARMTRTTLPEANEVMLPDEDEAEKHGKTGADSPHDHLSRILNLCIFGERYEVTQLRRDCLYTYTNAMNKGKHANEHHIALVYENAPWYWTLRDKVAEDFLRREDRLHRENFDQISNAMNESQRTELMLEFALDVATRYEVMAYQTRMDRRRDDVSWRDEANFLPFNRIPSPEPVGRTSLESDSELGTVEHDAPLGEDYTEDDDISLASGY